MLPLDPHFKEFLRLLNALEARYLIVGGYAVARHGHVRATGDLDLFVESSDENAARLIEVLRQFGFGGPRLQAELFTQPKSIVRLGRPPTKIELMNSISGVGFAACHQRRSMVSFDGLSLPFLDLDDLLVNKAASGRYKDLADIDELSRLHKRGPSAAQ